MYGAFSGVKISYSQDLTLARRGNQDIIHSLRQGWLVNGVDTMGVDALTSSAHTIEDIEQTANAFDTTLTTLRQDGII